MKGKAETIGKGLEEAVRVQATVETERNSYLPLAESGSELYFVIKDLIKMNSMYRLSLAAFLILFQKALKTGQVGI